MTQEKLNVSNDFINSINAMPATKEEIAYCDGYLDGRVQEKNQNPPSPPFRVLSFQDIKTGNFDSEWLRDRIILVGITASSTQDYFSVATNSLINS